MVSIVGYRVTRGNGLVLLFLAQFIMLQPTQLKMWNFFPAYGLLNNSPNLVKNSLWEELGLGEEEWLMSHDVG